MNIEKFESQSVSKSRFVIGAVLFVGGFLSPLLIPVVSLLDLSTQWKAVLTTGLVAGLPEIGMLAAVAVLGKPGFKQLKELVFSLLHKHTSASEVGPARYRLGLVMFCIPVVLGLLQPYAAHFVPVLGQQPMAVVLAVDLLFASSFLVLGAGFWQKIHQLFVHTQD